MKLTQRDIQYIMNEVRNIVVEKRGVVNENAVDSVKAAGKVKGAAKKVAQRVRNTAKNAAQMANGSGSKSKKGQRPGQPQTAGNAMRKNTKVPTTSNE